MPTLMLRLDGFLQSRRWLVLAAWVLVLAAALPFAARQSENLTGGGFDVPGSGAERVQAALAADFPSVPETELAAVLVPAPGAGAAELRAALDRVHAAAAATPRVALPADARARAARAAAQPRTLVVPLRASVSDDVAADVALDLRQRLGIGAGVQNGVETHLVGQGALWAGMQELTKHDLERAEMAGFPLVLLILLGVFGSFAAATLPLVFGFGSVLVTGALIFALSRSMEMSVFVTNMASMIGIGVAVDYSLFVLARYREEVQAGMAPAAARATAMATSGVAVLFSGITVIVSLAGLWLIPNTAIRSMALGAILVVAVSMLAAATLLPALIRLLGARAYAPSRAFSLLALAARSWRRRRPGSTRPGVRRRSFWERWTTAVMRRPVVSLLAAGGVLLVLAVPALDLQTGNGALRQFPADNETRRGFAAAAAVTGPGAASPVNVLASFKSGTASDPANRRTVAALRRSLSADPAVARVRAPVLSHDGRRVLLRAVPRADGESAEAKALVARLRAELPDSAAGSRARIDVGGVTAQQEDLRDLVAGSMWKIVAFVLGLSFLVLLVLLRSLVLPLKAVVMNLSSVGAAYGVLVAVFQWGWVDGLFGFESTGYVDVLTPPLLLAVVFGLSMDYEVFLLSRIRERFERTGDTRRAVSEGLSSSARVITSAALIMVAVFAVFVGTGVPSIKQLGLGTAVAIAVDATLVRLVLVPAAMELLGRWNWWLPRPLERLLPQAAFERPVSATS